LFSVFFFNYFAIPAFANNNANTNNSTMSVNPGTIPADGSTTATVSITVKDDSNNQYPEIPLLLQAPATRV